LPKNLEDYPSGTQVLALYPATTSYYRATVISAPVPGTGMGKGVRTENGKAERGAIKGKYRVMFVDDEEAIREVPAGMVIKVG
jgi:SAGA-associated factor 29